MFYWNFQVLINCFIGTSRYWFVSCSLPWICSGAGHCWEMEMQIFLWSVFFFFSFLRKYAIMFEWFQILLHTQNGWLPYLRVGTHLGKDVFFTGDWNEFGSILSWDWRYCLQIRCFLFVLLLSPCLSVCPCFLWLVLSLESFGLYYLSVSSCFVVIDWLTSVSFIDSTAWEIF